MYGSDMIYMFLYKIGQECIDFGLYTMNEMKDMHQLHFLLWNEYIAVYGCGTFRDLEVNWNVLQSWYSFTYSVECRTLFHVGRE